jgi:hypothetical protein
MPRLRHRLSGTLQRLAQHGQRYKVAMDFNDASRSFITFICFSKIKNLFAMRLLVKKHRMISAYLA